MLGGSLAVLTSGWIHGSAAPSVSNDFTTSTYLVNGSSVAIGTQFSFANSTGGYAENNAGLLTLFSANTPRITNKGWLREPAATNLITNTDWGAGWSLDSGSTKTLNNGVAPDGNTTAVLLQDKASGTSHALTFVATVAAGGGTWTASVYVRRSSGTRDFFFNVADGAFGNLKNCYFLLSQGAAWGVSDSATVKAWARPVGNYWLCTCTFTMPGAAAANLRLQFSTANGYGGSSYTGDGTSGIWMWGPQCTAGSVATSFIPASIGTRSADVITIIGNTRDTIARSQGTINISHSGGTIYGARADLINDNGTVLLGYTSSDTVLGSATTAPGTPNRFLFKDQIALAWDGSGRTVVLNGNAVATGLGIIPSSTLFLGSDSAGTNGLAGYIQHLNIYNTKNATPQSTFTLVAGNSAIGFMLFGADSATPSYPNTTDWDYFQSKGVTHLRLTIRWPTIQTSLGAALDATQVTNLQSACASAASRGIVNIFSPMFPPGDPSPSYNGTAIGAGPTSANYANFWSRMATALTSGGVPIAGHGGYHLGNEPSVESVTWDTIVQDSVTAIRAVDTISPIYIQGQPATSFGVGWATASWNPPNVTDPNTNIIYDAHEYFDNGAGGVYSGQFSSYNRTAYQAVIDLLPFLNWASTTGNVGRAWVGEWGIPGYARNTSCTISGSTLTVAGGTPQGLWDLGMSVSGSGVTANSVILSNGTGTGGNGTYTLSQTSAVAVGETITGLVGSTYVWLPTLDVFNAALVQSGNIGTMWYYGSQNTNQGGVGYFNPNQQPGGVDDLRVTHMLYSF